MRAHCKACCSSKISSVGTLFELLNLIVGFDELLNCTLILSDSGQLDSTSLHLPKQLNSTERHTKLLNSTIKYSELHIAVLSHVFVTPTNRSDLRYTTLLSLMALTQVDNQQSFTTVPVSLADCLLSELTHLMPLLLIFLAQRD